MYMNLDGLEATARAATPGPWMGPRVTDQWPPGWVGVYAADENGEPMPGDVVGVTGHVSDGATAHQDAAYIAAVSPDVVLKLIAVVRAAEACCIDNAGQNYGIPSVAMRDALSALGAKP